MNSRAWYGVDNHTVEKSESNVLVDRLLSMYADAISRYFAVVDSRDYTAIMKMDKSKLPVDKLLFLDWFSEKGLPFLKKLAETNLRDRESVVSKLEYELYILEEEMDFQYPEDVRSTLISIVNDLPDYIEEPMEIYATVNSATFNGSWYNYLHETNDVANTSFYQYTKDIYKPVSKYEESAQVADSSFFYLLRGIHNGNDRVLQVNK